MPENKIKNYRLSVLNGKDQQKNEKDDYGDQFSANLLSPLFLLSFHPLEGVIQRRKMLAMDSIPRITPLKTETI